MLSCSSKWHGLTARRSSQGSWRRPVDGRRRAMSIYTTLWQVRFPRTGDAYEGCERVDVFAQGVPAHIGTLTPGYGYEAGDPYHVFLPPPLRIGADASEDDLRAVVFVTADTRKGTSRGRAGVRLTAAPAHGAEYRRWCSTTDPRQSCRAMINLRSEASVRSPTLRAHRENEVAYALAASSGASALARSTGVRLDRSIPTCGADFDCTQALDGVGRVKW